MSKAPTVITLTLPDVSPSEEATLLIQHGPLAHLMLFTALSSADLVAAIETARQALANLESSPPRMTALAITPKAPDVSHRPVPQSITLTVGKTKRTIPAHHLHAPEAQQDQAEQVAARLLASRLWDGLSPIFIKDVRATLKAMAPYSDKELTLFSLTDFVAVEPPAEDPEHETTVGWPWQVGQTVSLIPEAVDEDGAPLTFAVGRIVEIDLSAIPPRLWLENLDGDQDVWVNSDQISAV